MPRRGSKSRSERRQHAFDLFDQGYINADVARIAHLAFNTVTKYRLEWQARNEQDKLDNPMLLQDVLGNTFQMLRENDQVRTAAWDEYRRAKTGTVVVCENCEHRNRVRIVNSVSRNAILATVMRSQEQRAKLLGVMGIKAEFFAMVTAVKALQDKLVLFMERELCAEDRDKLDDYLSSPELAPYFGRGGYQSLTIDTAAIEEATG